MGKKEFTKEELQAETYKMAYLFGLLHYHYASTLMNELGKEQGENLVRKAVKAFAVDRGQRMRKKAVERGVKPTTANLATVNDLPAHTFYTDAEEKTVCPFADAWQDKGKQGQRLGLIYCDVNDPWKIKSFDPQAKLWRYVTNRNLGDACCDAVNVEYLE
jgi:hypothetical protein